MLREANVEEDLDNVVPCHYRLSKIKQRNLKLAEDYGLEPGEGAGSAKAIDPREEFLSQILARSNEIFLMDELTEGDAVDFLHTVANKVTENERAMMQFRNNTREQVLLGDYPTAVNDSIKASGEAQRNQMMQLLSDPE